MGNKEALPRGCVQYLSAGTGITHSVNACHQSASCHALITELRQLRPTYAYMHDVCLYMLYI